MSRSHSSSASAAPSGPIDEPLIVAAKALNMIAWSTTPATRRCSRPGRMAPASAASSSIRSNSDTTGTNARDASRGWAVSSCWPNSAIAAGVGPLLRAVRVFGVGRHSW
jgi:hypothetical protein